MTGESGDQSAKQETTTEIAHSDDSRRQCNRLRNMDGERRQEQRDEGRAAHRFKGFVNVCVWKGGGGSNKSKSVSGICK